MYGITDNELIKTSTPILLPEKKEKQKIIPIPNINGTSCFLPQLPGKDCLLTA